MSGTVVQFPGRQQPQEWMQDPDQHRRQLAQILGRVANGGINATVQLTLEPNSATTTYYDPRISLTTCVLWMPSTSTAATENASGNMWAVCSNDRTAGGGKVVIHHTNSAVTTRTFTLALIG